MGTAADGSPQHRHRLENLLLIGALATFAAWMTGKVAEMKIHRRYQANTIRNWNVLSTFYLGLEVISSMSVVMTRDDFWQTIRTLRENCYVAGLPG